jgi:hypothetical protein
VGTLHYCVNGNGFGERAFAVGEGRWGGTKGTGPHSGQMIFTVTFRDFFTPLVILLCRDLETLLPRCRFCCALHGYKCTRKWREKKKRAGRMDGTLRD